MAFLLDTNLLLRLCDANSPLRPVASQALERLLERREAVNLTAQNFIEFRAVATRPVEANGFGWSPAQTKPKVDALAVQFPVLEEAPGIRVCWLDLVARQNVCGKRVHDARLVAVMVVHGVSHLRIFNTNDFKPYAEITVVHPNDVPS